MCVRVFIWDCELLNLSADSQESWGALETNFFLNTTLLLPFFVFFLCFFTSMYFLFSLSFYLFSHPHARWQTEKFLCLFLNGKKKDTTVATGPSIQYLILCALFPKCLLTAFLLGLSNVKTVKYCIFLASICECACLIKCDCAWLCTKCAKKIRDHDDFHWRLRMHNLC